MDFDEAVSRLAEASDASIFAMLEAGKPHSHTAICMNGSVEDVIALMGAVIVSYARRYDIDVIDLLTEIASQQDRYTQLKFD